MTAKRDRKSKPKKAERPKVKKETLRDLSPSAATDDVKGGRKASVACNSTGCDY